MPRLRREVEEKIVELIDQKYKDADISRKLGVHRTTVANRRKEYLKQKPVPKKPEPEQEETVQQEQPLDPQKYTRAHTDEVALSNSAMSKLSQIHELLGSNNLEEMLESVYADQVAADKYRVEYIESMKEYCPDAEAPKTFAGIIAEEEGYAGDLKFDLDIYMQGFREDRKLIEELKAEAEMKYDEGYRKGKNDHALLFPCVRCGEPCTLKPGTEIHWLIVDFLREHKIAHDDCTPKYERIFVP